MGERGAEHVRANFDSRDGIEKMLAFYGRVVPSWRLSHREVTST
jgi:hypothetical protein